MARYSAFLGHRVEVQYRAGDTVLPASGTFVADSGRSIFLEQHLLQRGQQKHFRWEIPYQYIVRLAEAPEGALTPPTGAPGAALAPNRSAVSAPDSVATPSMPPLSNPPKTA